MSSPNGLSDRILILGDESKSSSALERLLRASGYNARAFDSFQSAQDHLRIHEVALIVIEPATPRITGSFLQPSVEDSGESLRRLKWALDALEFCKGLRDDTATAEVPVLVVSKSQRPQDKVTWLNSGATDYISKPYQRAELLSRTRAHLRNWHSDRERSERFEQLNVLHAVSSVLASSLEPDVLLRGTLSVLIKKLSVDAGVVYLKNAETGAIAVVATEGISGDIEGDSGLLDLYSKASPLMADRPFVLDPIPESKRKEFSGEALGRIRALVCAPIKQSGEQIGAICLFSESRTPFQNQQAELLSTICNQLSVALENARLYVETKKSASQLSFVYNLGTNLMTSLEMDELLGYAVFTVGRSLECDVCAVVVNTTHEPQGVASAIYYRSNDNKQKEGEWYEAGQVSQYFNSTACSLQPGVEVRFSDRLLSDPSVRVETIVPLMFDDTLLGALICGSYTERPFSPDDQKLLGAVSQRLSLAIRNTELYQRTKDTSINLAVEVARRTREIEEQKRFTEKIIDSLPVSLYVVDRDMRIVAWNRNREVGGQGISRDEVLGRNVFHVLARQPRRMLEDEFLEVLRTGTMVRMEQESWVDGQKKHWKISKIPMRVDNAEVTHVITVGEDVTEQKKMNEAVIHAEKLASIGRLASGVVHELNNPLATVAACAEALTARVDDLKDQELHQDFAEYLQIIRDEAFRCKTITNSLLDFSHQRQAEKLPADINQIIDLTLQLIKHHPKLGKMHLVKELDDSLASSFVNEGQMKQVFIALISNAYDAMEGGGTLTIRTRWNSENPEHPISVEFIDTGAGISPSNLPKIFDPFFTTKPLGRGTGLGLSVCYGIVSEHGGKIEVDSVEGLGSTFRILLPATVPENSAGTPSGVLDWEQESKPEMVGDHGKVYKMENAL
jgi:two-component system NtrC family sensor kinase